MEGTVIGTLLHNRYRIDAKLGEGGMGVVYRAHDSLLQRPVAIKTLSPALFGEEGARRLIREAQSAAKLNHPHIVSIFDAVEEGGQFAIVMELVEGQTLRELLPMPVPRLIEMAIQVLQGLEYAHAQGIVHRDIKPENVIITKEGTAKLMDFGLARSEGRSRLTQTGMVVGTVAYLGPGQALGGRAERPVRPGVGAVRGGGGAAAVRVGGSDLGDHAAHQRAARGAALAQSGGAAGAGERDSEAAGQRPRETLSKRAGGGGCPGSGAGGRGDGRRRAGRSADGGAG